MPFSICLQYFPALRVTAFSNESALLLVLYWTGTWSFGVDDERVKEGKRLIFPGLRSWLSRSRESARNRELEKERERERGRKKDRQTDRNRDPSSDGAKVF